MKRYMKIFFSFVLVFTLLSFVVSKAFAEEVVVTDVTNESELITAVDTGGNIRLINDIELTKTLTISKTVTLDLNGYMIRQTGNVVVINGTGLNSNTLTIIDSRPEENVHYFIKHGNAAWEYTDTYIEGVIGITGGIITGGNNIANVSSSGGGAIKLNDKKDKVVINGGTIVGNYSARAGGCSYGGAVTMNGGSIIGNAGGKFAGAIALSGDFTMTGGMIKDNYSPSGSNEYKFWITDISIGMSSNFTMTGGVIEANIATVNTTSTSTLQISDDATIIGNIYLQSGIKANISGGKITGRIRMTKGSFTMTGGEITEGVADDTEINYYGSSGGGVSVEGGNFTMTGGTIYNNLATTSGGGVYVNGGTFIMEGGYIYSNTSLNGGGVYVNSGDVSISNGYIGYLNDNNELGNISTSSGGGIYVAGGNVTITGGNIIYNESQTGDGGGLYLNGGTFIMEGGSINYNLANNGGGVYVLNATFDLIGGVLENNQATTNGGGFYIGDSSTVNLSNGDVSNNIANNGGGFYQTQLSNNTVTKLTGNCNVYNNVSLNGNGGGVYIDGGSIFRAVGGKITYNKATITDSLDIDKASDSSSGVGGGVYIHNGTFSMYDTDDTKGNAAIFGNTADYAADDLYASGVNTSFDAISVIDMLKDDAYKSADSWFEDFPINEEHITLSYDKRNDNVDTNDLVISKGRYKEAESVEDKSIATTVLYRNCTSSLRCL